MEIGFEKVADGFMNQDSGVARSEDDRHFARRGVPGVEKMKGLVGRFPTDAAGRINLAEVLETDPSSPSGKAVFADSSFFGDGHTGQFDHRPDIRYEKSLGVCDQYVLDEIVESGFHFFDCG